MLSRLKHFTIDHAPFLVVALISGVLLFSNLGNIYLWQDEAETACVARNTFKFGIPIAWDGTNLVNQVNIIEWNDDFIWTWHPWGMFYAIALSYALFGVTTFAARFPFALAGLLSVVSLYFITYRWTKDKLTALLTTVIVAGNLQFILHCRQCRYYALISLTTIFIVWGYWNLKKRYGFVTFVIASTLLFHSCYVPFFPTMLAIALFHFGQILFGDFHVIERFRQVGLIGNRSSDRDSLPAMGLHQPNRMYRRNVRAKVIRFSISLGLIAIFTAPWFFYAVKLDFAKEIRGGNFLVNFLRCVGEANRSLGPVVILFIAAVWLRRSARKESRIRYYWRVCSFLLFIIALNLVFIPLVAPIEPELYFRYMLGICPLTAIVIAVVFREAVRRQVVFGCVLVLIYFTTTSPEFIGDIPIALLQQHTDKIGFERTIHQLEGDIKSYFVGIPTSSRASGTASSDTIAPGKIASYFDFLYEITHDYDGPNEGIVKFLKENARPGDYVFTSYGVPSLIFYCNYAEDLPKPNLYHGANSKIDNDQVRISKASRQHPQSQGIRLILVVQMELLSEQHLKNLPSYTYSLYGIREFWYIPREVWGDWANQIIRGLAKYHKITFEKFVIPYPNIAWGNRPDRSYHKYRTVENRRGIVVYKIKIGKKLGGR